jgi:polyphosphate kinase
MKKSKLSEFNNEQIERVVSMAQEERKPFEVIKEEFGLTENEVTEFKMILQLGDIIQIADSTNEKLNNQTFFHILLLFIIHKLLKTCQK